MNSEKKGILYILLSSFCFASMAAWVKSVPNIPLSEKIFFRCLVGTIVTGYFLLKNRNELKCKRIDLLIIRAVFELLAVTGYYYTLSKLPLCDAVILNKISPVIIIILSYIFLKEKIQKNQIYAVVISLIGVLFVIKPQFNYTILPALVGLCTAVLVSVAYIAVRQLRLYTSPEIIVFSFSLFSVIATIPFMIIGKFVFPSKAEMISLFMMGLFATGAEIFLTKGYRYAPASKLAIYDYANIIFSTLYGILLWSEMPDLYSIFGGILILSGGIINYIVGNKENKVDRFVDN
ncbi:DMT family transporter [Lutibacter sp. B2]|nr:DMT family transporter [Lutibacter sp. B2]